MVQIQNVTKQDIPQLLLVQHACFAEQTPEIFEKELESSTMKYWCAKMEHDLVGYICISMIVDEAELHTIAVHPKFQNKGVGKRLLAYALEFAQKNGAKKMFLEVREDNIVAQKLYKTYGFTHQYTRKHYYGTKDAYILEKSFL